LKPAYYRNYCIDSNQGLHTTEDCQVLIAGGPNTAANKSEMADGRHFEKSQIVILRNRLTAFDEIWRGDAYAVTPYS